MAERQEALRVRTAAELFAAMPEVGEDIAARPGGTEGVPGFLSRLLDSPTPEEAATFAAHALAPRHAVWWGHECLMRLSDRLDPMDAGMLRHAASWVAEPGERSRSAAAEAALASPARTPGVWLAMAVGWTGGSMVPPHLPEVPPPPYLVGRGVNAAVLSALARCAREERGPVLSGFVGMARAMIEAD